MNKNKYRFMVSESLDLQDLTFAELFKELLETWTRSELSDLPRTLHTP